MTDKKLTIIVSAGPMVTNTKWDTASIFTTEWIGSKLAEIKKK